MCAFRIGELIEEMDKILRTQCDYDPASGENYDFDRFVNFLVCLNTTDSHLQLKKRSRRLQSWSGCNLCFYSLNPVHSDFNIHAGPVDTAFIIDHLSYKSPYSEQLLVEDLSLTISQGSHLLVVGNTGTGKTSLLRVLNRLWEADSGERMRPKNV